MVRKVIWSASAKADKMEILKYWKARNKPNIYSKKLNLLFKESVSLISKTPGTGHITIKENFRVKVVRDYLIIYELTMDAVHILSIFDGRRNPEEFNKRL